MAEFLTTKGIAHQIEQIIKEATYEVALVSPYIKLDSIILDRLKEADRRKVKIIIIYREKDKLGDAEREALSELMNLELRSNEDLHAKCYYNESLMIITSMNIYDYSEINNREMGVLISKKDDEKIYNEAVKEASSILYSSQSVQLEKKALKEAPSILYSPQSVPLEKKALKEAPSILYSPQSVPLEKKAIKPTHQRDVMIHYGFCVRCGVQINYDPNKPYCRNCYDVWAEWENPDYEENFCHRCSRPYPATMDKPLCSPCYKIS